MTQKIKDIIQKAKEDKANKILERQKRKQARILKRNLKREAKILRRKKRRERYELERVRLKYNEIMKKAVAKHSNKGKTVCIIVTSSSFAVNSCCIVLWFRIGLNFLIYLKRARA